MLHFKALGGLSVWIGDRQVVLPPSRKTRALLAYLVGTRQPQRRDHLCELLWELPDDPRGALRWSLSKLRLALGPAADCLHADRERVWIDMDKVSIDFCEHREFLDRAGAGPVPLDEAADAVTALRKPILAGMDMPNHPTYQAWLTAVRDDAERMHRRILMRLALDGGSSPDDVLPWCREWFERDPLNIRAATALKRTLVRLGRAAEGADIMDRYVREAKAAGHTEWESVSEERDAHSEAPGKTSALEINQRQIINFCTTPDGVRIAMASVGAGPPMVKAANWLNHLELDWYSPIWAPLFRDLAADHCFIRYDERGNGLSDWDVSDLSFEAFVKDLEAVVAETTQGPVPILGISQGCAVAIEYAARHPERVSHLILWGGYAQGWRIDASPEVIAEREAIFTLVRQGWGRQDPAYRHLFSATFMPSATSAELDWFNNFQRETVSAPNAVRFLEVFADIDVRHRLAQVKAPTLVMHARGDRRIPLSMGAAIAAGIPGSEFVSLDTDNHLLLGREAASADFVQHVREFLKHHS